MASIVAIVEGHGEEEAEPLLLRRIAAAVAPTADIEILPPIRVERNRVVRPEELERAVELAARMVGTDGSILVLLDADDDCPAKLGPGLLARARAARRIVLFASYWPRRSTKRGFWRQRLQSPGGMISTRLLCRQMILKESGTQRGGSPRGCRPAVHTGRLGTKPY